MVKTIHFYHVHTLRPTINYFKSFLFIVTTWTSLSKWWYKGTASWQRSRKSSGTMTDISVIPARRNSRYLWNHITNRASIVTCQNHSFPLVINYSCGLFQNHFQFRKCISGESWQWIIESNPLEIFYGCCLEPQWSTVLG